MKVGFDNVVIDCSSFGGGRASSTREILHPFCDFFTKTKCQCIFVGSKHDKEQEVADDIFIRWSMNNLTRKPLEWGWEFPLIRLILFRC